MTCHCSNCDLNTMEWDFRNQYWICFECGSYQDETGIVIKQGYWVGHTVILGMIRA